VCRACSQITKTLSLWQAQLKSNWPSCIPNTVVAFEENSYQKVRLLEKDLAHSYVSFIYLEVLIIAFHNIDLKCVKKNIWMEDPFAFENPGSIVEFNLTLVGDMNGYKLVLHSH
jgi:hypothetical protein